MNIFIIQTLLLGLSIGKALSVDFSLCYNQINGAQIPNNQDCASYYVCNHGVPQRFVCSGNTLYDHKLRVCNWADRVTCGQIIAEPQPPVIPPFEPIEPAPPIIIPEPQPPPEIPPPIWDGAEFYPGIVELQTQPGIFACNRDGFYFAPHPKLCEKYYICENYKIHAHQCGAGIHWDYIFAQCDYPQKSNCFGGGGGGNDNGSGNEENENGDDNEDNQTSNDDQYEDIGLSEEIILPNEEDEEEDVEVTTVGTLSPIEVATVPPINIIDPIPDCPGEQAFYPYAKDCHKYYICIGGIPIVTSCPESMVWDAHAFQCSPEQTTECLTFEAAIEYYRDLIK